jgi:hypothetical protein
VSSKYKLYYSPKAAKKRAENGFFRISNQTKLIT